MFMLFVGFVIGIITGAGCSYLRARDIEAEFKDDLGYYKNRSKQAEQRETRATDAMTQYSVLVRNVAAQLASTHAMLRKEHKEIMEFAEPKP